MKKRLNVLSGLLCFALLVAVFASVPVSFAAGTIPISSVDDLMKIGRESAYPMNGSYVLTQDLDLGAIVWYPIGNSDGSSSVPFTGTFDGNGHVIRNLTSGKEAKALMHNVAGWGLFSTVNGGTVKNLIFENVMIHVSADYDTKDGDPSGYDAIGTVAGYISGGAVIEQIAVLSGTLKDVSSRQVRVGGIVGASTGTGGTVRDCFFGGDIVAGFKMYSGEQSYNNQLSAAGILGSSAAGCRVEHCLFAGTICLQTHGYAHPILSNYNALSVSGTSSGNYYLNLPDLSEYGGLSETTGCTQVSREDLYDGASLLSLGSGWTVREDFLPCPTGASFDAPSGTVESLKTALETALSSYIAGNYTTAEDLENFAATVVSGVGVSVSWEDPFTLTKASYSSAGSITGSLKITKNGESRSVPVSLTVAILPTMTYTFSTQIVGRADGSIDIDFQARTGRAHTFYWGTETGRLEGYSAIGTVDDFGKPKWFKLKSYTYIPVGATHLWLYDGTTPILSLPLPQVRLLTAQTPLYTFGVMSDLHLDNDVNTAAVEDVVKQFSKDNVDFVVSLGDNTSSNSVGQLENWKNLQTKYSNLNVFSSLGNHDIIPRHTSGLGITSFTVDEYRSYVNAALKRFQTYFKNTEAIDFTVDMGDDMFLFLGMGTADDITEAGTKGGQALGEMQLEWLEEQLDDYYNVKKKTGHVFLMYHFYTRKTIDSFTTTSALALSSSEELEKILAKYPDVIYFCGHNHYAFDVGVNLYCKNDGYTLIHTPSAGKGGIYDGMGHNMGREAYYVEVYADYVLVRAYNFFRQEWYAPAQFLVEPSDSLSVPAGFESVTMGEISDPADSSEDPSAKEPSDSEGPGGWNGPVAVIVGIVASVVILGAVAVVVFYGLKKKKA